MRVDERSLSYRSRRELPAEKSAGLAEGWESTTQFAAVPVTLPETTRGVAEWEGPRRRPPAHVTSQPMSPASPCHQPAHVASRL